MKRLLPGVPRTGHVGLNVTDLPRSRDFYREVLGLDLISESDEKGREYAFLGHGGQLVLTLWRQSKGSFATDRPGLHHLSFEVETIAEVRQAEHRLRARQAKIHHGGIVPHREGASSGGIFFEDPDGTRLEIYAAAGAGAGSAPSGEAPTCGFF